jgi:hypothetical protein
MHERDVVLAWLRALAPALIRERPSVFDRFEKRVGIARERAQADVAQTLPVVGLNAPDDAVSFARLLG